MPKVVVGMSGGVDSSFTAYLLQERGYDIEGVSFLLYEPEPRRGFPACCSLQSLEQAAKTAHSLGIPHRVVDARDAFLDKVINPFVKAYTAGITPNPCILCNKFIKFPFLLKEAENRGAEYISTGHYARIEPAQSTEHGAKSANKEIKMSLNTSDFKDSLHIAHRFLLKKGIDPKKDQSYVMYVLSQEALSKLILPLGCYKKEEVRKMADELDLPSAKRAESQEICFIEGRNYLKFIDKLLPFAGKSGPIIDVSGKVIGTHKGIYGYTIGQRKGMGISSPEPLYVIKIDVQKNTIYAGPHETAKRIEFLVKEVNWINTFASLISDKEGVKRSGNIGILEFRASVKVRSTMKDEPATIFLVATPPSSPNVRVVFDKPQWAPAPGQSAVFYDRDMVIGGGVIL